MRSTTGSTGSTGKTGRTEGRPAQATPAIVGRRPLDRFHVKVADQDAEEKRALARVTTLAPGTVLSDTHGPKDVSTPVRGDDHILMASDGIVSVTGRASWIGEIQLCADDKVARGYQHLASSVYRKDILPPWLRADVIHDLLHY